jgi:uncharacterized protein YggE
MKTLAIAITVLVIAGSTEAWADGLDHRIMVSGSAEVRLPPDFANIDLGVLTQGKTVTAALSENNERMARVVDALHALGVQDKDIQTTTFAVTPQYPRIPNTYEDDTTQPIVGYYITNKVTVRVADLTKIAKIIDISFRAGANTGGQVTFEVANGAERLDAVRQAAVADARHKAEVLAAAAQVRLGPAISVTDTPYHPSFSAGYSPPPFVPPPAINMALREAPILPGQISLTAMVTVIYETR